MESDNRKVIILPHDHGRNDSRILELMPGEKQSGEAAEIFHQLSDGTRLQILWLLCHSEECVCNIAAAVGMSMPAVSHHLRSLKQSGLIGSRRVGKEVYYTLMDTPKARLVHKMIDDVFEMNCPGMAHLDL